MNSMQNRGFTLVETLVAITVILTAIVGPLYSVQQALNASRSARDQLIASSLAQEGVEYVRAKRDGNYLLKFQTGSTQSWLYGLDGSPDCFSTPCIVDPSQNDVRSASAPIPPLYLSETGLYNQMNIGTPTIYTRTVQLSSVGGGVPQVVVTVTVSWQTRGQDRSVVVTERLYNWL